MNVYTYKSLRCVGAKHEEKEKNYSAHISKDDRVIRARIGSIAFSWLRSKQRRFLFKKKKGQIEQNSAFVVHV